MILNLAPKCPQAQLLAAIAAQHRPCRRCRCRTRARGAAPCAAEMGAGGIILRNGRLNRGGVRLRPEPRNDGRNVTGISGFGRRLSEIFFGSTTNAKTERRLRRRSHVSFAPLNHLLSGRQLGGLWHTAVVAYGKEYFFGGAGVQKAQPVRCSALSHRHSSP